MADVKFDFDEEIDRKNTNSVKHDFAAEYGKPEGLIPLWVADMDFKTAPQISETLAKLAERGVFGYSDVKEDYFETVNGWFSSQFGYTFRPDWLVKTPGVIFSICMSIRAFTNVSESVMIQTPVYHPFKRSIEANGRKTVCNSLVYTDGKYHIDFDDFEKKIIEHHVKLFILCSPHNPVGRVWTRDELARMGDICVKHGVVVLSDEIHCDFTYPGHTHAVFASVSRDFPGQAVVCTAPSKTFNLAGLQISNTFIAADALRSRFTREMQKTGVSNPNVMGLAACQSAYRFGGLWVDELNDYLANTVSYVRSFLKANLPQIKLVEPEGTYLLWLDCGALGLSETELDELIAGKAGLWVNYGAMFGEEGRRFIRINIGCPLKTVARALERLKDAVLS